MRTQYHRGRDKEQRVKKQLLRQGFDIVVRSAGSRSPIDLVAIDSHNKMIRFVQCKLNITPAQIQKLLVENIELNGNYLCEFYVL